ncbi:MAG: NUDIX domain-containing protein [Candidatus Dormibacteraeota bacterium]|uniref:NUDIX domain-containing protein n=2 Tax=Candidatus Aeolococcus gillhamiae TaxID=3127015 RepID=A0A934N5A0_9BACT|nr:NUDIX domain-containing protein [Candidatus Dormibacteraeota bacterium]
MPMSSYVQRLRDALGSDLLLLPAVVVLPRDPLQRLLLVRHVDTGSWAFLGGGVEPGETPELAGVREVAEEIGLEVELGRLLTVVGGQRFEVTYQNGDRVAYMAAVYEAQVVGGDLQPDGTEVSEAQWFGQEQLTALDLTRFARNLAEDLRLAR